MKVARPSELFTSFWSNLARPSEQVTSLWSDLVAQASQRLAWASQGSEKVWKWPFFPPFWVFSAFFFETSKNLLYCTTIGVKQLNSVSKNLNISKWRSPDEFRVWHKVLDMVLFLRLKFEDVAHGSENVSNLVAPKIWLFWSRTWSWGDSIECKLTDLVYGYENVVLFMAKEIAILFGSVGLNAFCWIKWPRNN